MESCEANARLIVTAVNHHQELVEALRTFVLHHEGCGPQLSYDRARAVLAQVEQD